MADGGRFTRLVPILRVADLDLEVAFYEALGLRVTYRGSEYPDFIALGDDQIEFGIEHSELFDEDEARRVLTWQLGVRDVDEAAAICVSAGFVHQVETHEPAVNWRYRTIRLRSPNGYAVHLEGPTE
ncbi:MAG: hypothetical protein ABR509_05375 [Candidatus Limnocylindria bacterium]